MKFDIEWAPIKEYEPDILDDEEKKLFEFFHEKELDHVYTKLIQSKELYIESLQEFENYVCRGNRLLKSILANDYSKLQQETEKILWKSFESSSLNSSNMPDSQIGNDVFEFSLSEVNKGRLLGKGTYGEVYQCNFQNGVYALKEVCLLNARTEEQKKQILESLEHEMVKLCKLKHPNIVSLVGFSREEGKLWLLMRKFDSSLKSYFKEQTPTQFKFTQEEVLFCTREILHGLAYLHSQNIAHCDMKTDNILIWKDPSNRIKSLHITDFGVSRKVDTENTNVILGTPQYHPPELREKVIKKLNTPIDYTKADIFALGIIIWEIINCYSNEDLPFSFKLDQTQKENYDQVFPIFSQCLDSNPSNRPLAQDLFQNVTGLLISH